MNLIYLIYVTCGILMQCPFADGVLPVPARDDERGRRQLPPRSTAQSGGHVESGIARRRQKCPLELGRNAGDHRRIGGEFIVHEYPATSLGLKIRHAYIGL